MDAGQRGLLETVREAPGMLLFLLLGLVGSIRERKILVGSTLMIAVGIAGTASLSPGLPSLAVWLFVWSTGAHIVMTLRESFCVALSEPDTRGRLFGLVTSLRSLGTIVGAFIVWQGMEVLDLDYEQLYWIAAALTLCSALVAGLLQDEGHTAHRRKSFVFQKKYLLFYSLALLFGVRKQIFLVFAPWVLIRVFQQDAPAMARLVLCSAAVGIVLKPLLGRLIDLLGERKVLMADSALLFCVCACYGLAERWLPIPFVLPALFACYILDDMLFSLRSAHVTYLSKIATSASEITASISASYSIEHVVSMVAPLFAGLLWMRFGYPWVFFMSGAVAVLMFFVSSRIPRDPGRQVTET